jgi:RND family efflux transporter MFP subunit
MKRIPWVLVLILMLVSANCSGSPSATPIPTISLEPQSSGTSSRISASAESVPAKISHLGFIIPGYLKDVAVSAGDKVRTGDVLAVLSTPELEYSVEAAEATVHGAELNVTIQNFSRKKFNSNTLSWVYLKLPFELRQVADAQLVQAQAALDVAKGTLAQNTIKAPFDGTIISVDVQPGEFVQTGQRLILLADLEDIHFETTDLSENNVTAISVGHAATIFVDALNEEFPGTVTRVFPISETLGGDVVYRVSVNPNEKIVGLLWGMSAEIDFVTE